MQTHVRIALVMSLAEGATARSFPVLKKIATNAACLQPVTRIYFRLATLRLLQWTFLCTERTSAWQRLQVVTLVLLPKLLVTFLINK